MQVINGVRDLDVLIEQPCLTYEECLAVRRSSPLPMVLDECVDDIGRGGARGIGTMYPLLVMLYLYLLYVFIYVHT